MLQQLDSSLWVNEVSFKFFGIDFGNRMTCIQLSDKSFWLHSPTNFDRKTCVKLLQMGDIHFLVAPSLMHNLFIMDWKKYNYTASVIAPTKAKKLQADIKLDEISLSEINELVNNEISCIPLDGMPLLQEFVFIHHASKTLILTDLAFNFGTDVPLSTGIFLKLYGAYNKFCPTLTIRASIKDKGAFGKSLQRILAEDFDRIIVSHGNIIEKDGKNIFKQAFRKYLI